jgi:hypothetical protein
MDPISKITEKENRMRKKQEKKCKKKKEKE